MPRRLAGLLDRLGGSGPGISVAIMEMIPIHLLPEGIMVLGIRIAFEGVGLPR